MSLSWHTLGGSGCNINNFGVFLLLDFIVGMMISSDDNPASGQLLWLPPFLPKGKQFKDYCLVNQFL
jgi:hypothetical protein